MGLPVEPRKRRTGKALFDSYVGTASDRCPAGTVAPAPPFNGLLLRTPCAGRGGPLRAQPEQANLQRGRRLFDPSGDPAEAKDL